MSDETPPAGGFAFAPAKPKSAGQQAADRGPRTDPIAGQPKRRRRTRAELEAAGAKPKRKAVDTDTAILKVCMRQLRKAGDPARIVATLRIMFE